MLLCNAQSHNLLSGSVGCFVQEEQVIPALLTLADRLTTRYEGTQKADEQLLQSGSVRGRLRSAMLVRVGERRLIRRFKEAVIHLLAGDDEDGTALPLAYPSMRPMPVRSQAQRLGDWQPPFNVVQHPQ